MPVDNGLDEMKIRVLGCSGGIGQPAATTSFLVDHDILIDAGTGVGGLTLDELARIDHVFLTHSHLDHINSLPLMSDSVGMLRDKPVNVYARSETIMVLREHIMNGQVWPDFTIIPTSDDPFLKLHELSPGSGVVLGTRRLKSIEVSHTVPAVGYLVGNGSAWLAFSGDTGETTGFWDVLNGVENLRFVVVETTFTDAQAELARIAGHLCPRTLAGELAKLERPAEVYITHLMPGSEQEIMDQIATHLPENTPRALVRDQVFEL